MKDFVKIIIILLCFGFMGSTTFVKEPPIDPCWGYIGNILIKDTLVRASISQFTNDTVIISTIKDSLWDIKTEQICNVLKDECKSNVRKVLIVNQSVDPAQRDTRFGKRIYFRTCP